MTEIRGKTYNLRYFYGYVWRTCAGRPSCRLAPPPNRFYRLTPLHPPIIVMSQPLPPPPPMSPPMFPSPLPASISASASTSTPPPAYISASSSASASASATALPPPSSPPPPAAGDVTCVREMAAVLRCDTSRRFSVGGGWHGDQARWRNTV